MSAGEPDREEDRIRAAEYALGLLDAAEARAFEARLAGDAALRAEYAAWAEGLAGLADGDDPVPPREAWTGIEARLFADPSGGRGRSGLFWGIGAVLAAALAFVMLYFGPLGPQPGPGADLVARLEAEGGGLEVSAGYDADTQRLEITRAGAVPAPGRAFELWLIVGDAAPVSLGLLPQPERATLSVPEALAARIEGAVLAISDEPEGGSPTGQPTGAVLAAGPLITGS